MKSQCHLLSQVSEQLLQMAADQISPSVPASSLPCPQGNPLLCCLLPFVLCSAPAFRKHHSCLRLTFFSVGIKPSLSLLYVGANLKEAHVPILAITPHLCVSYAPAWMLTLSVLPPTQKWRGHGWSSSLCTRDKVQGEVSQKDESPALSVKVVPLFSKLTQFNPSL